MRTSDTRRRGYPAPLNFLALLTCAACAACAPRDATPATIVQEVLPEAAYDALPVLALADVVPACLPSAMDACSSGIIDAAIGPSGAVAFWGVDGKQTQLYRFDSAGVAVRLGRAGGGPGEYRVAAPLGFDEQGNVAIADISQRRFTRFGVRGDVISTDDLPYPIGLVHVGFSGGSAVAVATDLPRAKGDSMAVHHYLLDVSRREPVRRRTLAFRRPAYAVSDLRPVPPAFSAHDHFAHLEDGTLLHSPGGTFVIDEYAPDDRTIRRFGFEMGGRPVSDAEQEAAERRALARVRDPRMRSAMQASMREAGRAARHPAITRLVTLGSSGLAVRQAPRVEGDSVTWVLFDAPAKPVGRVGLGVDDRILGAFGGRILFLFSEEGATPGLHWGRLDTLPQPPRP